MIRSIRSAGEESWPLATAAPSVLRRSQERAIFLDEPAGSPVGSPGDDVTITLTATGAALSITCAPGREATITVVQAGEVVLKETIKL